MLHIVGRALTLWEGRGEYALMSSAATGDRRAMVAIDWGTTSCRFVLVSADGTPLARRSGPGIIPLAGSADGQTDRAEAFVQALQDRIGDWLEEHPGIPLVMSGMVGADRGWRDAGYREAPVSLLPGREELVPVTVPGHPAHLVPGVKQHVPAPDVMRGEETQVLGALLEDTGTADRGEALIVVPGTHSKWVQVAGGRIQHFRTYMTGDLFAALSNHTILAREDDREDAREDDREDDAAKTTGGSDPSEAFAQGLELAFGEDRPSLSRHLFHARSRFVLGELAPDDTHDFLSGLVIGDEAADALALLAPPETTPVLLIASEEIGDRYTAAFDRAGLRAHRVGGDPATRGLHAIAQHLADTPVHPNQEHPLP